MPHPREKSGSGRVAHSSKLHVAAGHLTRSPVNKWGRMCAVGVLRVLQ